MTGATSRAPTPLQPRLKATATSDTSPAAATASNKHLRPPSHSPQQRGPSQRGRVLSTDALSDKATTALIRRTLCPQLGLGDKGRLTPIPIEEVLPPLTSSNAVDFQLYALIAIIIREFVYTWYARITPDQVFVEEVVKIIAHCTRGLEQRLRKVDLESLILDEIPELLEAHVKGYRSAHYPLHPAPVETDPRTIYHSLWPSIALSPVPYENDPYAVAQQRENESAYRQLLVQGVLAVLLPTEDLENDCLTALVGQILSEMIIGGGLGGKASEPWMIWEGITKVVEVVQSQLPNSKAQDRVDKSTFNINVTETETETAQITVSVKSRLIKLQQSTEKTFWLVLQYGFVIFTAIRFAISTVTTSSVLPSRISFIKNTGRTRSLLASSAVAQGDSVESPPVKAPILGMRILTCVSTLLEMDTRMPWLQSTLSLLQWIMLEGPAKLGDMDGTLDRFLSHTIRTHLLSSTLLPPLLRAIRGGLFPNNAPGPPRAIPDLAEQRLIRQRCAIALLELVPSRVQDLYFGVDTSFPLGEEGFSSSTSLPTTDDDAANLKPLPSQPLQASSRQVKEVEELLNVFSDSYCNKHLMYGLTELIIVKLIPELKESGVEELLEERFN